MKRPAKTQEREDEDARRNFQKGKIACEKIADRFVDYGRKMDFTSTPYTSMMHEPTETKYSSYKQAFGCFDRTSFENSLPKFMLNFTRWRSSLHILFTAECRREGGGCQTGNQPEHKNQRKRRYDMCRASPVDL